MLKKIAIIGSTHLATVIAGCLIKKKYEVILVDEKSENIKKLKNGDLDYLKEVDPTEYIYQIFYHWNQKEYLASEIFDLTEEEKSKINHQMIDEIDEEK